MSRKVLSRKVIAVLSAVLFVFASSPAFAATKYISIATASS